MKKIFKFSVNIKLASNVRLSTEYNVFDVFDVPYH